MEPPKIDLSPLFNEDLSRGAISASGIGRMMFNLALKLSAPEQTVRVFEEASGVDLDSCVREMLMLRIVAMTQAIAHLLEATQNQIMQGFWDAHAEFISDERFALLLNNLREREAEYLRALSSHVPSMRIGQVFARSVGANEKDARVWMSAGGVFGASYQTSKVSVAAFLGDLWKDIRNEYPVAPRN